MLHSPFIITFKPFQPIEVSLLSRLKLLVSPLQLNIAASDSDAANGQNQNSQEDCFHHFHNLAGFQNILRQRTLLQLIGSLVLINKRRVSGRLYELICSFRRELRENLANIGVDWFSANFSQLVFLTLPFDLVDLLRVADRACQPGSPFEHEMALIIVVHSLDFH